MGSSGSKSKPKQQDHVKVSKVAGYVKLEEDLDSSGDADDGKTPPTKLRKPLRNEDTQDPKQDRLNVKNSIADIHADNCSNADSQTAENESNDTEDPELKKDTMSLSMTTQVSPKSINSPREEDLVKCQPNSSDKPAHPLEKVNHLIKRKSGDSAELGAIVDGKLGSKDEVRKHLEEQGLITEKSASVIGEGILGELREVGILRPHNPTDETVYILSDIENKRRLPPRLPILPVAERSLPNRLLEMRFGCTEKDVTASKFDENEREMLAPNVINQQSSNSSSLNDASKKRPSDIVALKIKFMNLDMM